MSGTEQTIIDKAYSGYVFSSKTTQAEQTVYTFDNKTGTGQMCCYTLCDGIQLSYNTLYLESVYQKIAPRKGILQIDHCLDGCYEFKLKNNEWAFFSKGDLSIVDLGVVPFEYSRLPMKKYIGLSFFIDIARAQKSITDMFSFMNINVAQIKDVLCKKESPALIIKSRHEIYHIMHELYTVDEKIRIPYSLLKVLELLLLLSVITERDTRKLPSFSKHIYEAAQSCYAAITENPFDNPSIQQLAQKHGLSESSLKRCFTAMTGISIGQFIKRNRLEAAAALLCNATGMSIGEVAEKAGYWNQSKFSSAFKTYFGETPGHYKRKFLKNNLNRLE